MARSRSLAGGLALLAALAAGACLVLGLRARGPDPQVLQGMAGELDMRVRETLAGVHSRVTTLAELPLLSLVVAADAKTIHDLNAKELAFLRPRPNETIEIGQILTSNEAVSLLRLPAGTPWKLRLDPTGVHLVVAQEGLAVMETVPIRPSQGTDRPVRVGALAVAHVLDLRPTMTELATLGIAAALEAGDKRIALSGRPLPGNVASLERVPLGSDPDHTVVLVAALPANRQGALVVLGVLLALIALGGAAWSLRRRPPTAIAPSTATAVASAAHAAPDTSSHVLAAGALDLAPTEPRPAPGAKSTQVVERRVGRYTVLKPLGAGGMAEVFLARSTGEAGFEKLVALKVLQTWLAYNVQAVEHFLNEARLASRLTHPNIVQIIDLGKAGEEYFIAMEYIDGADLQHLLERCRSQEKPVPLRVALQILRRVCDGLDAAHSAVDAEGNPLELVHRDVKCANVFVAKSGAVKVGDFGIAKANQLDRRYRTETGLVKGTAAYMAPEHRLGQPIDRRADVFGVGAIGYELITGEAINLDLIALLHRGKEGWPHLALPSSLRQDVPAELDALLWKALAFEQEARFSSCDEMEAALADLVERHGLGATDKQVAQWVTAELGDATPTRQAAAARPTANE